MMNFIDLVLATVKPSEKSTLKVINNTREKINSKARCSS